MVANMGEYLLDARLLVVDGCHGTLAVQMAFVVAEVECGFM